MLERRGPSELAILGARNVAETKRPYMAVVARPRADNGRYDGQPSPVEASVDMRPAARPRAIRFLLALRRPRPC